MGNSTRDGDGVRVKTGVRATVTGWVYPVGPKGDFVSKAGNRTVRRGVKCQGRDGDYWVDLMATGDRIEALLHPADGCLVEAWGSEEVRAYTSADGTPRVGRTIWLEGVNVLQPPRERQSPDDCGDNIPF